MKKRSLSSLKKYASLLSLALFIFGCKETQVTPTTSQLPVSEHLVLGNPSQAEASVSVPNNYLIVKKEYALSYSRDRGIANWVSWHVSKDWLGDAPRQDDFRIDAALPADWYRVSSSAYTGTGFDRGHNIPSGDRTNTQEANSATFLMTNILPQAPTHNRELWSNLEEYTRQLVNAGQEVYVIMGSYGTGGTGSNGPANTIANGRVTVPSNIWKVLVVLPNGDKDLERITTTTRVIAVNTPNQNTVRSDWSTYRTTVDALEASTGYDLLSVLPKQLQAVLESKVDNGPTN
ncbi:DNA/RNA non-specific endonuclease [Rufibacter soli]